VIVLKRLLLVFVATIGFACAIVLIALATFAAPTVSAQLTGRTQLESLQQGDLLRTYRQYTPPQVAQHPGVIFVLQGASGGMKAAGLMEAITGLDREADRLHWLVVYPDAAPVWSNGWDPFTCCDQNPDVAFMSSLIDKLERENGVDPDKVFVTGWSRGAMMAYRIGCELSTQVAAIAPVDGNMSDQQGDVNGANCHPGRSVSVMSINGSADLNIPIDGGHSPLNPWETVSYAAPSDVIEAWRQLDGCDARGHTTYSGPSITTTWSCRAGSSVALRIISGGDHAWPGTQVQFLVLADLTPPQPMDAILPDMSFNASQFIADFFASHGRATAPV
jgi:polyhydroxybutyrate depolymerase